MLLGINGTNKFIDSLLKPETTLERAVILGRNLWRRGLALQLQLHRIRREEADIAERLAVSLKKAARRKVRVGINKAVKYRAKMRNTEATCE